VQAAAQALQARQESASLAARRLERGLVDVSSTLEQERLLGEARSNLVDARFEQGAALAALAKALGGGWEPTTALKR
jgi:multidrug efflux system outer membrane protein